MSAEIVSVGRTVHVVLADGEHRPAVVVRVWSPVSINVQVFTDGRNDEEALKAMHVPMRPVTGEAPNVAWLTSLTYDAEGTRPMTWHWPERVEDPAAAAVAEERQRTFIERVVTEVRARLTPTAASESLVIPAAASESSEAGS